MSEKNPYNPGEKDGTMQTRTLIAFVLMGLVLFGLPYFFKSFGPPKPVKEAKAAAPAAPAPQPPSTTPVALPATPPAPVDGRLVASHDEQTIVVDTDLYRVVLSNRGAVVTSWTLKKYPNAAGKPLEVVNSAAAPKVWYPLSYFFRSQSPSPDLNQALFVPTRTPDGLGVTFEYNNNGVAAKKTFQFQSNSYRTLVTSDLRNNGIAVPHLLAWRGGFGDFAVQNASGFQHSIHYDVSDSKLVNEAGKAAKNGPTNRDGNFSFAGLEDQYFTAVFLPDGAGGLQTTLFDDYVPTPLEKAEQPFIGSAVGGEGLNQLTLFVGPKDIDLLKKANPKLEQIVDFGMFWFLAKPLFLVLHFLNQQYVHNYGWSIIVTTLCINLLLFPLRLTNMKSMQKMKALQPRIQEINDRYKNLSLRDPRMQQKNTETMELYKQNGANPMGGCLPLVIQMPFLFAFYKVLAVSIEMRNANFLWVHDLSQPEHLALRILPILMIASGFLMQRMTPQTGMDPSQARMMMFMPLVMGFFFYGQSSGLVLYWLTGNLVGIAQQYFFNKTMIAAPAQPPEVPKITSSKAPVRKPVRK